MLNYLTFHYFNLKKKKKISYSYKFILLICIIFYAILEINFFFMYNLLFKNDLYFVNAF